MSCYKKLKGFTINDSIYVDDSDSKSILNEKTGEFEKVKQVPVLIEKDLIRYWITDCGLLDELGIDATLWSDKIKKKDEK